MPAVVTAAKVNAVNVFFIMCLCFKVVQRLTRRDFPLFSRALSVTTSGSYPETRGASLLSVGGKPSLAGADHQLIAERRAIIAQVGGFRDLTVEFLDLLHAPVKFRQQSRHFRMAQSKTPERTDAPPCRDVPAADGQSTRRIESGERPRHNFWPDKKLKEKLD